MKDKRGFTLIELAIVIGVIALLVVSLSFYSFSFSKDVKVSGIVSYVADWKKAMARFYSFYGRYPSSLTDSGFNSQFLKTNPLEGISLVSYNSSNPSCSGSSPSIVLDFGEVDLKNRVKAQLIKGGVEICVDTGTRLTINVKP